MAKSILPIVLHIRSQLLCSYALVWPPFAQPFLPDTVRRQSDILGHHRSSFPPTPACTTLKKGQVRVDWEGGMVFMTAHEKRPLMLKMLLRSRTLTGRTRLRFPEPSCTLHVSFGCSVHAPPYHCMNHSLRRLCSSPASLHALTLKTITLKLLLQRPTPPDCTVVVQSGQGLPGAIS